MTHRMALTKIAVGVDFSPESDRAVEHAMMIARAAGAALLLVHVARVPPPTSAAPQVGWLALQRERLAADRARLAELREQLEGQGVEVSQLIADGEPDPALADVARELGVELIAVGTHGRAGMRRLLLGSVAEKTVRLASSSVLVARGDAPSRGYRHVVVGTDLSPLADRALEQAVQLIAPGGHVQVVYAWQAPYLEYDLSGRVTLELRAGAEAELGARRERLLALPRPPDVTMSVELRDGAPVLVLEELSRDAQLVVVGSHGRRGVRRFLLGSVAEATVRHARCSVLVVR